MRTLAAALLLSLVTAGCASDADPQFHLAGHVGTSAVTHVVATTPSHLAQQRIATRVDGNGNFELALEPDHAWVVTFVDSRQVGTAMLAGALQIGTIDALVPRAPGALDLGTITFGDGRARASAAFSDVTSALGLDEVVAAQLGAADDLSTRYANPDVDSDGVIDALQPDHDFRIDLYGTLRITIANHAATVDDLVRGNMTGDVGVDFVQTGIVASLPPAYAVDLASAQITFDGDYYGSMLGAATPVVPAGTPIGEPELRFGSVDGRAAVGAFARGGHDVPGGAYRLAVGDHVLTFGDVRPETAAQLAVGANLVVPFLQMVPTEPTCTTGCQLASIQTTWLQRVADGWVPVEPAALTHPAHLDIVRSHHSAMQYLGVDVPAQPTSTLAWSDMTGDGMSPLELAGITTTELCYVAVTYDDQVGMRVTSVISNPACY